MLSSRICDLLFVKVVLFIVFPPLHFLMLPKEKTNICMFLQEHTERRYKLCIITKNVCGGCYESIVKRNI